MEEEGNPKSYFVGSNCCSFFTKIQFVLLKRFLANGQLPPKLSRNDLYTYLLQLKLPFSTNNILIMHNTQLIIEGFLYRYKSMSLEHLHWKKPFSQKRLRVLELYSFQEDLMYPPGIQVTVHVHRSIFSLLLFCTRVFLSSFILVPALLTSYEDLPVLGALSGLRPSPSLPRKGFRSPLLHPKGVLEDPAPRVWNLLFMYLCLFY